MQTKARVEGVERVDRLLVRQGLLPSRASAQAEIDAGHVLAGGVPVTKSSAKYPAETVFELTGRVHPWVSRAGLKLDHGLAVFGLSPAGASVLDVGASTGGFTQVCLAKGAARVIAVDVGHNQLAEGLRRDPRVHLLEGTNARSLQPGDLPFQPDWLVCDVSFISLRLILPAVLPCLAPGAPMILLVKPQFEVGRASLGKGGVVSDPVARQGAVDGIERLMEDLGVMALGTIESPIKGGDGNVEFLLAGRKGEADRV